MKWKILRMNVNIEEKIVRWHKREIIISLMKLHDTTVFNVESDLFYRSSTMLQTLILQVKEEPGLTGFLTGLSSCFVYFLPTQGGLV